jgi:hypothetical protein
MTDPVHAHGNPLRSISAIVPVESTGARLGRILDNLAEQLHDLVPDFEIVLIDDGSGEGSLYMMTEIAQRLSAVRVVRHTRRQGLGACWREGIALATKQYALFIDVERISGTEDLAQLARWGDRYDVVAAYRQLRRANPLDRAWGVLTRLLLRWLLGVHARDLNSGLLLVRTSLLKGTALTSKEALVRAELRLRMEQRTPSLAEVPFYATRMRSGSSRRRIIRATISAIIDLIRLQRQLRRERGSTPPPSDGTQHTQLSA